MSQSALCSIQLSYPYGNGFEPPTPASNRSKTYLRHLLFMFYKEQQANAGRGNAVGTRTHSLARTILTTPLNGAK